MLTDWLHCAGSSTRAPGSDCELKNPGVLECCLNRLPKYCSFSRKIVIRIWPQIFVEKYITCCSKTFDTHINLLESVQLCG